MRCCRHNHARPKPQQSPCVYAYSRALPRYTHDGNLLRNMLGAVDLDGNGELSLSEIIEYFASNAMQNNQARFCLCVVCACECVCVILASRRQLFLGSLSLAGPKKRIDV